MANEWRARRIIEAHSRQRVRGAARVLRDVRVGGDAGQVHRVHLAGRQVGPCANPRNY
jgi:hypothetical protein